MDSATEPAATKAKRSLSLVALGGIPLVQPGDDLAGIIVAALAASGETLLDGDVLVLAQKIVSKAEDRYVTLADVTPAPRAVKLAAGVDKDPRLVELILSESTDVVRSRKGVLVVAHRLGLVLANAGIDASNVEQGGEDGDEDDQRVLLLPKDPDASAAKLVGELHRATGCSVGIVINDSLGRAWRNGTVGAAIGAASIEALCDLRGRFDLFGRPLQATQVGMADEVAAAASLLMGQADEGRPVVLVRGLADTAGTTEIDGADALVRPPEQDLFR